MSTLPPRVLVAHNEPQKDGTVLPNAYSLSEPSDPSAKLYISWEEHAALLSQAVAQARAEAFEEMAAHAMKEAHDVAGEPFLDMDGAQHYARLSGWAKSRAEASRAKPEQGGGG